MPINFPNSPSPSQLYSYDDKTWEWNGTYWEVYSALTSYVGGTGTTNNIPKWSGVNSLTDSLIQSNANGIAIGGSLDSGYYVNIYTTGATGLFSNATTYGIIGNAGSSGIGVQGNASGGGYGVQGIISTGGGGGGWGVYGESYNGIGVHGKSYGDTGPNIGVRGETDIDSGGTPENIGGYFSAINGGTNYSVQLTDGTEGTNKVLVSQTSDGKANWSDSLTGLTSISATTYYNYPGSSSANCVSTFFVTNISGCSPVNILSPLNVTDGLSVTGTSTFTSQVNFTAGISASTFSATTYENLPVSAVTSGTGISASTTNGVSTITNTDLGSSQNIFKNIQINGATQFSAGSNSSNLNFSGVNITITSASTNTLVFSAGTGSSGNFLPTSGGTITGDLIVTGNTNVSGSTTSTGNVTSLTNLQSLYSVGDEGGEILLSKPQTNTSISGTGVTIDIFQNRLRFFEQGGSNRGAFIELTAATASVGSNLLAGGGVSSLTAGTGLSGNSTTGAVTLQLSASSYSMFVNNTASADVPSQVTYKDTGDASFASYITWTTTTPTPNTGHYRYRWTQVGNTVTFYFIWTIISGGGAGQAPFIITLPPDMPQPATPTGFNVANYVLQRYQFNGNNAAGGTGGTNTLSFASLQRDSGNTQFVLFYNVATILRWFSITGQYFV